MRDVGASEVDVEDPNLDARGREGEGERELECRA